MQEYLAQFDALMKEIKQNIEKAIVGKSVIIEYLLIALAAGGHVLIEDVPGIGKSSCTVFIDFHPLSSCLSCREHLSSVEPFALAQYCVWNRAPDSADPRTC